MATERPAVARHAEFVMQLGPRLLGRYSDGGATTYNKDRRKDKRARVARRRNRRAK
jgi:hypothetical protein